MGKNEKKVYLLRIIKRYKKADRKLKAQILEEFCAVCSYHRKHAIRLLNGSMRHVKKLKKAGRKSVYNSETLLEVLRRIWLATDQMCSKKLVAALPLWLPHYEYGKLSELDKNKVLSISSATIDRILKPEKVRYGRKGLCGTRPGSLLKNQIPIRTDNWDVNKPGFFEADSVAHCGNSLEGDFAWSITLTDIHTAWTENRAVWGKGSAGIITQIHDIEQGLPFLMLGFDCDNVLNQESIIIFSKTAPLTLLSHFFNANKGTTVQMASTTIQNFFTIVTQDPYLSIKS